MDRVLLEGQWYAPVASESLYELDFEKMLVAQAPALFPGYTMVEFKKTVESDVGAAQADYALVANDYLDWWVVEVEMSHHSLDNHVVPQVERLSGARYGQADAEYLFVRAPHLDPERLADMVRGAQPRVFVVVNAVVPLWAAHLARFAAEIAYVEVFRSQLNKHAYRYVGYVPQRDSAVVSVCRVDAQLPGMLLVEAPAGVPTDELGQVDILFDGHVTTWVRTQARDRVWLTARGRYPLPEDTSQLELVRAEGGRLAFRPRARGGR